MERRVALAYGLLAMTLAGGFGLVIILLLSGVSSPSPGTYVEEVSASTPALVGCSATEVTIRGAAVGKKCSVTGPSTVNTGTTWACSISGPDAVQLHLCCIPALCAATTRTYYVFLESP
jgi:hypothetical protein